MVWLFIGLMLSSILSACGGGGSGTTTSTTPPPVVTPPPAAAAISLSASQTSVASDNSTTTTITATVVDAANAAVKGVTIAFSADTGFLSLGSAVSDASGKAAVTFSSGTTNPSSRTATITATASGKSTQIPIRITGATVTVASTASSLVVGGANATLSVTVKSASGSVLSGQAVTLTMSGTGSVTLTPSNGTTDSSGTLTSVVTPGAVGQVTVTVAVVGETRTFNYTVSGASVAFQITSPTREPTPASICTSTATLPVTITVNDPLPSATVVFVSTLGAWDGGTSSSVTKVATSGVASATLCSSVSGVANVQVYDKFTPSASATRTVSFTAPATAAYRITIQASPAVVAPTSGGTTGVSSLLASVFDISGNPVSGATVAFSILNPTGGGETILPAVGITSDVPTPTLALGQTKSTFTSGSLPSGAAGITIRATVIPISLTPPTIFTGSAPSGTDAAIVIGGTAGSATIGRASVGTSDSSGTLYILPMSVLVADSNGNPVANTTVSLSAWPIAFNAGGTSCAASAANDYYNEDDANPGTPSYENLSLDGGEDGVRKRYPSGTPVAGGSVDSKLTPPNSAAGTLPAVVTTDSSGVATFNLTYTKSNSLWIIDRIRARTFVQGTETLGQIEFRLPALITDIGPPCLIPNSPYLF